MAITISAVIITKNEELNIGRCLQSLNGWVEEIIVIDSHSTDRTREICESFVKVRFESFDWQGYSKTKNHANGLAQFDYVLSLDADEEVSAELKAALLALKTSLTSRSRTVYELDRLTNYCGQWIWHSGWRPDFQLRFFPRGSAEWDGAEVHETLRLIPATTSRDGSSDPSPAPTREKIRGAYLHHYSFYSITDHVERVNRYSSLGAQKIVRRKKKMLIGKAIFNSFFRFVKAYVIKLGFLDGFYGFVIAVISGYAVFLKYSKAHQILKTQKNRSSV